MDPPTHKRHQPPTALARPRELVVALPPMRSNVNVSRILRTAGCFGVRKVVLCGNPKVHAEIARDAANTIDVERHRSLLPVLQSLKAEAYELVGLEQTDSSISSYQFAFQRRTAIVVGHERHGLSDELIQRLDRLVEIPIYGLPHSHNAATAAAIAMYEYCRQFPEG